MGKGDRKTKRGKIAKGTFGNSRPHKPKSKDRPEATKKEAKPAKKKTTKAKAKS
ncbi:30S ribosomal protein THX [Roseivirga sp.]|uniref:30S ribosomal protein THX n=1 Tax=Roseivirga sp. TaxID=1964215 RepID=UPI003B51D597